VGIVYDLSNYGLKVGLVFLQSVGRIQMLIAKFPLFEDCLPNEGYVLGLVV